MPADVDAYRSGSCTSWLKSCIIETTRSSTHSKEKDLKTFKSHFKATFCALFWCISGMHNEETVKT